MEPIDRVMINHMLLVVDIGNTQTTVGIFKRTDLLAQQSSESESHGYRHLPRLQLNGNDPGSSDPDLRPLAVWRLKTDKHDTQDDIRQRLHPLLEMDGIDATNISAAAISNVVPNLALPWKIACERSWGIEAAFCTADEAMGLGLFKTSYSNPSEIGADRVADAIAARWIYGCPCIIVDFGTATNMEAIDAQGTFVGGSIAPGIMTGAEALVAHASRLAGFELEVPEAAIGKNTREAMLSGIMYGEVGRVDTLVRMMREELQSPCGQDEECQEIPVVATGGLSNALYGISKTLSYSDADLTLQGLKIFSDAKRRANAN